MGTEVEVLALPFAREEDVDSVRAWFEAAEATLSRFRPDSELSRVNARARCAVRISPLFRDVLSAALAAARATGGLVDPTVVGCLESAGYSRSFENGPAVEPVHTTCPNYRQVRLSGDLLNLPHGLGLDLGGVAKGWAVDQAAPLLSRYESWLLNAGGDLLAKEAGPGGDGWLVGVDDPFQQGTDALVLRVRDTAIATSSVMRRRWRLPAGDEKHHIIDPRTGRPAETDLASVTVLGQTVVGAEVEAKALLILGQRAGRERAEQVGITAVFIDDAGRMSFHGGAGGYVAA
jgi:thiamine biosynthesis lipoprotein